MNNDDSVMGEEEKPIDLIPVAAKEMGYWSAVLCGNVEVEEEIQDRNKLNEIVEYLLRQGVINFTSEFRNGNAFVFRDDNNLRMIAFNLVLENKNSKKLYATTSLEFIPYDDRYHNFTVIK